MGPGPDGKVWFLEMGANKVGRIDPATGEIAEFAIPSANSLPMLIAPGSDGALWFTELATNRIARVGGI